MIVALDNTFLTLFLNRGARPRPNPATGKPIDYCELRIEALIDSLTHTRSTLLVPAPALAEALCVTPDAERLLKALESYVIIEVAPFNTIAAVEFAHIMRGAFASGDKRSGVQGDWQRVKIDRQIVSIAKAHGATVLYTDDDNQTVFAELAGLKVIHTWGLDLPDKYRQTDLMEGLGRDA